MALPKFPGISGMAVYVPTPRVLLDHWCNWTGAPWDKVSAVVGNSFRVCPQSENAYTMAAAAVLRLIENYDIDPAKVGMLALGTESSTDNAAGAVIVKGMIDRALEALGKPPLARSCEVPEYKQACLGGVYGLKNAIRFLRCDGRDRVAIVVSSDIAEYARHSTGEQTQGAGAVAMLVESNPKLLAVDIDAAASSSDYRGLDFRKPMRRFFMPGYGDATARLHDFPVFNGKYSTTCYVDEVIAAIEAMAAKQSVDYRTMLDRMAAVLMHRPYHRLPSQAMAAAIVWSMRLDEEGRASLRGLCSEAGVNFDTVVAEISTVPDLFALAEKHGPDVEPAPAAQQVVRHFAKTGWFKEFAADKLSLGSEAVKDLGNLYTAALPAWIASACEAARDDKRALAGERILTVGYGSGDASEAIPMEFVSGWESAAAKIGFKAALSTAHDLTRAQYEALHDGRWDEVEADLPRSTPFAIVRVGEANKPEFQDIGIEYYTFTG